MFRHSRIPLSLEGFGVELLEVQAERRGVSVARFMERASQRYVVDPDRAAPSRRVPAFLKDGGRASGHQTVEVELDAELWEALEQEAAAQDVSLELIVAHAAMLLAADLNP